MAAADQADAQLQKLNCMLYDDLTFFDIRGLMNENPLNQGNYFYTFCARTQLTSSQQAFAYLNIPAAGVSSIFGSGTSTVALTDGNRPTKILALDNPTDASLPRHLYYEL